MKEYKGLIEDMNDEELKIETKDKIWSSTFWNRENHESHKQVSACYEEWFRRKGDASIYKKIHEETKKEYSS